MSSKTRRTTIGKSVQFVLTQTVAVARLRLCGRSNRSLGAYLSRTEKLGRPSNLQRFVEFCRFIEMCRDLSILGRALSSVVELSQVLPSFGRALVELWSSFVKPCGALSSFVELCRALSSLVKFRQTLSSFGRSLSSFVELCRALSSSVERCRA